MSSSTVSPTEVSRTKLFVLPAALAALGLGVLSLFVGRFPLNLGEILAGDELQRKVFLTLRLSRTLVALLGGAALGVAGFVFQTVFRNPLASPDMIGISSGAAAGAAAGILFFGGALTVTLSAFGGAVAAMALAVLLASADRTRSKSSIVLAGIAVHALFQAILMLLKLAADPNRELASIEFWIMGSLSDISGYKIGFNLLLCLICMAAAFLLHRQTVLLAESEGEARMLGLSVGPVRFLVLLVSTLMVSSVVSLTGLVSFIGLLAPHGARLLTKKNDRGTMLLSALLGASLLCGADILARSLASSELPVSIFTSLIGAPVLVVLALGKERDA